MRTHPWNFTFTTCCLLLASATILVAEDREERFDRDPGWDGHNHRSTTPEPRLIRQDFGYSRTSHAGGDEGEMGGFISPAAEPAYYAKKIPTTTFRDPLMASGTFASTGRQYHALIGFFNAGTLNEWRTPNTIALWIAGRGDVFYAWLEYATGRWRAGGDEPKGFPTRNNDQTGRKELIGFSNTGEIHHWLLKYEPEALGGRGVVTATIDGHTAVCHLAEGHKADGAVFNRFGLLNVIKSGDTGGEVWLDDLAINGVSEDFAEDPEWDQFQNRRTYTSTNLRPRFDFGFSPTSYAGGKRVGELGGLIFRGDCRYPDKMAYYGDRLDTLTLEKPLKASGRVSLRRGVTDSTVLLGFFHSRASVIANPSQNSGLPANFLGIAVEGPSREGFLFYPTYRNRGSEQGSAVGNGSPVILPDGADHEWSLLYDPSQAEGRGRITVTLDGKSVSLDLTESAKATGPQFDHFGIVTTWIDGNSETIYFDDLTYTSKQ